MNFFRLLGLLLLRLGLLLVVVLARLLEVEALGELDAQEVLVVLSPPGGTPTPATAYGARPARASTSLPVIFEAAAPLFQIFSTAWKCSWRLRGRLLVAVEHDDLRAGGRPALRALRLLDLLALLALLVEVVEDLLAAGGGDALDLAGRRRPPTPSGTTPSRRSRPGGSAPATWRSGPPCAPHFLR